MRLSQNQQIVVEAIDWLNEHKEYTHVRLDIKYANGVYNMKALYGLYKRIGDDKDNLLQQQMNMYR
jgi:hypothetical protein